MKIKLDIPAIAELEVRKSKVPFDLAAIPAEKAEKFFAQALMFGLQYGLTTAASGAKSYAKKHNVTIEQATDDLVQKRLALWEKGLWSAREAGPKRLVGNQLKVAIAAMKKAGEDIADDPRDRAVDAFQWFHNQPEADQAALLEKAAQLDEIQAKLAAEMRELLDA